MFIGREREQDKLNRMYHSNRFEFAMLYGRRRVGKTTLIREFMKDVGRVRKRRTGRLVWGYGRNTYPGLISQHCFRKYNRTLF